MNAFPWAVLITGASTLGAGIEGSWLRGLYDTRRDRQQRQRDAYAEFALRLDELIRIFGAPGTLDDQVLAGGTAGHVAGQVVGSVQRAYFAVFLAGSKGVQPKAGKAWQAAWDIHDWLDSGDGHAEDGVPQLRELVDNLRAASRDFADAARRDLA